MLNPSGRIRVLEIEARSPPPSWLGHYLTKQLMESIDTETAVYELHVQGKCVAMLYSPRREDMFWCSYEIRPIDQEADRVLRDREVWRRVNFTIMDSRGWLPNQETFSGAYDEFCDGKTDRLTFRTLWPPPAERKSGVFQWLFRKLFLNSH